MISGYYINLDKAVEKRRTFDQQLNILKLEGYIKRFSGVEPSANLPKGLSRGEYGCMLSHLNLLKNQTTEYQLVFEDDIEIGPQFPGLISKLPKSLFLRNDFVIFGYGINIFDYNLIKNLTEVVNGNVNDLYDPGLNTQHITILDCKDWYRHGTFAYAVNKNAYPKLKSLIDNQASADNIEPIDLVMKRGFKSGALSGVIAFPPVISVNNDFTSQMIDREDVSTKSHIELSNLFVRNHDPAASTVRTLEHISSEQMMRASKIASLLEKFLQPQPVV